MSRIHALIPAALLMPVSLSATSAGAGLTFEGVDRSTSHAARAVFAQDGKNPVIILTNTSPGDTPFQSDVLSSLFFDLAASAKLTPVSATATTAYQQDSGKNSHANEAYRTLGSGVMAEDEVYRIPKGADGGWQFRQNAAGLAARSGVTQKLGIGTAGLGIFNGSHGHNIDYWP